MEPTRTPQLSTDTKTVLVVEDNNDLRAIFTRTFARRAFEVLTACDGLQAMTMLSKHAPDLVILDINMPHMSGLEVLQNIRANTEQHIPVIIVSGNPIAANTPEGQAADLVLLKPVSVTELVSFAHRLLGI
jgi:CheY-like chemotaxis protein